MLERLPTINASTLVDYSAHLTLMVTRVVRLGKQQPICRAENVRFKASVHKVPSMPVDWHKVEMHNWNQYTTEVDGIKVKLNDGKDPTIEFIPAAIEGSDPLQLYFRLHSDCDKVARHLEQIFDMQIGELELSSKAEWVIYNPIAKAITNEIGRVSVKGVGKINASLPNRYGEFEFPHPIAAAEFMEMPGRLVSLEQDVYGIKQDMKEVSCGSIWILNKQKAAFVLHVYRGQKYQ